MSHKFELKLKIFKEIGDKSYYVVQTVTDTKKKTLYIVSAFIGKKGYKKEGTSQSVDAKSPDATSKNAAANIPTDIISDSDGNVKHYIGFAEDGEADVISPKKPDAKDRADRLTKRFGEYETGVEGLEHDISEVLERAQNNNTAGAFDLAQRISKRFKGLEGKSVNTDAVLRYLNNAVISQQLEYRHHQEVERLNKKIARRGGRGRRKTG